VGDLSDGGVSFTAPRSISEGLRIDVELALEGHRFKLRGTVMYCNKTIDGAQFRIGLSFDEPPVAFKWKLADQALQISGLQRDLERERGTEVTFEEAARLWVNPVELQM
jgi:hypothetical protein